MRNTKRVTATEVARKAGVSQSLVSAVLSGNYSTVGASEDTRLRILDVAKKLNYKPSMRGRSLVEGKSFLVGLLCRPLFAQMIPEFVKGIQDAADEEDYSILIYFHSDTVEDEAEHLRKAVEREVDGLIVMPARSHDGKSNAHMFRSLVKDGTPVVQTLGYPLPGIASVTDDVRTSGYIACRHLIDLGHRRIAHYTHAEYEDRRLPGSYQSARLRYEGYMLAMQEAGLEPIVITFEEPEDFFMASYMGGDAVAKHPSGPTGVVAFNDLCAVALVNRLADLNMCVPGDISIIGADNAQCSITCRPRLTTLQCPLLDMGREALKMVIAGLHEGLHEEQHADAMFRPRLIVRESTASPIVL